MNNGERGHSYCRGWPIHYDGENWRYDDNNEICTDSRHCVKCGKYPTPEGYDACLGYIDGAKAACCGHGVIPQYVMMKDEKIWTTYEQ